MLDAFVQFLTYALVAVTLENAVLSRSLGSSRLLILGRSVKGILVCGGVVTIATVATCLLAYPVNRLLDEYLSGSSWIGRLRPLLFMLITTGSTLRACAQLLAEGGALSLAALAAAVVPDRR